MEPTLRETIDEVKRLRRDVNDIRDKVDQLDVVLENHTKRIDKIEHQLKIKKPRSKK